MSDNKGCIIDAILIIWVMVTTIGAMAMLLNILQYPLLAFDLLQKRAIYLQMDHVICFFLYMIWTTIMAYSYKKSVP